MKRNPEICISGFILYGDDFEVIRGHVVVRDGIIREVSCDAKCEVRSIVIPAFINAHTHIADSVAKEPPEMPLSDLVGPGGLKHRILSETPYEVIEDAMRDTIKDIFSTGTLIFADFREGGVRGVLSLIKAGSLSGVPVKPRILGRPLSEEDVDAIFELADGVGMSSVADHPRDLIEFVAEEARKRQKIFAIHAGERNSDDISCALDLHPSFIVHLVHASHSHFKRMQDEGISAVICVRSNLVTGVGLPPLKEMLNASLNVCIGTDNVMLNNVDIFREMEFVSKIFRIDDREVLKMCTLNPAAFLSDEKWGIEECRKANLIVLRLSPNLRFLSERNLVRGIVRRASREDIASVICGTCCVSHEMRELQMEQRQKVGR
ncbi:hypothetical protein DRN79_00620 [Methanosarcinales archaeon]|nr:MAG: hypothetical protein DRN79_00620 [Methanosarcinales archaeon]